MGDEVTKKDLAPLQKKIDDTARRVESVAKDADKKFDLWGHLPEKERALMNKEMEQKFMEKYDELTKQYYRTIAEKSRKK